MRLTIRSLLVLRLKLRLLRRPRLKTNKIIRNIIFNNFEWNKKSRLNTWLRFRATLSRGMSTKLWSICIRSS